MIQESLAKAFSIFKTNFLFFLVLCLISAILCVYVTPMYLNIIMPEEGINQEMNQLSGEYGLVPFSAAEIIQSLISVIQFSIISITLLIAAYKVKYIIDKRIFGFGKWRDWKFFIYISGISVMEIYLFQAISIGFKTDVIANLIETLIYCFVIVVFSVMLLPEEQKFDLSSFLKQ
jgi:hypothetical protein